MAKKSAVKSSLWAIAVIALVVLAIILLKQCNGYDAPGTGQAVDSLYYKHITDSTKAAVLIGAKEDFSIIENSYKDSIAKLLSIKPKTIKEIITITQQVETKLKPDTVKIKYGLDSNGCLTIDQAYNIFRNKFYSAEVNMDFTGDTSNTWMILRGIDSLTATWSERTIKRKKYLELSVINANPDITVIGVKAFRSPEIKEKDWSFGFQLGYGATYNSGQFYLTPYAGIGFQKKLFSFNLKKKNK